MTRVLLVGAMRVETTPLLALLERPRPRGLRLVEGRHGGLQVGVLACGVGPDKALARTRAAVEGWRPDVAISLGTCGALVDDLAIGDLVHADRLLDEHGEVGPVTVLGRPAGGVVTVREPVWEPLRRRALAGRGAVACEMEAAAVHRACRAAGVEVAVIKVVSDKAGAERDGALPATPGQPSPVEIARFKARALRLVQEALVPALPDLLAAAAR